MLICIVFVVHYLTNLRPGHRQPDRPHGRAGAALPWLFRPFPVPYIKTNRIIPFDHSAIILSTAIPVLSSNDPCPIVSIWRYGVKILFIILFCSFYLYPYSTIFHYIYVIEFFFYNIQGSTLVCYHNILSWLHSPQIKISCHIYNAIK